MVEVVVVVLGVSILLVERQPQVKVMMVGLVGQIPAKLAVAGAVLVKLANVKQIITILVVMVYKMT